MTQQKHSYNIETCGVLARIYESAWEEVRNIHPQAALPGNMRNSREELAKRICEIYDTGERDPETIRLLVVKAFDRWVRSN